jgi:hypothetical protein
MRQVKGTQAVMRTNMVYAAGVVLLAAAAMWLSNNLIIYIGLGAMVCLVLLSVWHHHKARVLSGETLIEYILTVCAAVLVLLGAALH